MIILDALLGEVGAFYRYYSHWDFGGFEKFSTFLKKTINWLLRFWKKEKVWGREILVCTNCSKGYFHKGIKSLSILI